MKSKVIGIIGGGQLGMMMIEEAHKLGAKAICLDPSIDAVAFKIADEYIVASFDDLESLEKLCQKSDVVTYEFENVSGNILKLLKDKYNFKQGIGPLLDSQDRLNEKMNALNNGLRPAKFYNVLNYEDLIKGIDELGYPCIYKTRTLGYDGHGQIMLRNNEDIKSVTKYLEKPGILEEFIKFDLEVSIVLVSDKDKIINFPIAQNIHKNGILDLSITPANINKELENKIIKISKEFMISCEYKGILAIEYFIMGNEIYFNEMAPRPHNSGHYTIEGCQTNQFKELCKFLLDIPIEEPKLLNPTIMKNILGEDLENVLKVNSLENVFVHVYGKNKILPKRKMGHITFTNTTIKKYNKEFKKYFV